MVSIPRLLIGAPSSGQGKTTIAIGLMAALARRGLDVAGFKVGPDYIDPGFHRLATGRVGRNLDAVLTSPELIMPMLLHGFVTPRRADLAIIEGVMGLFDGQSGTRGFASSAHVAKLTSSPVVLVVDANHTSRTIAAVVAGLAHFDTEVRVAGVIVNKIGSPKHGDLVLDAMAEIDMPVLGMLGRDEALRMPERHLGLVPADERDEAAATLDLLAARITENVDLDTVIALANAAIDLDAEPWNPADHVTPPSERRPRVAIAGGRAFTFRYAETAELLDAAGCEVVEFDPTTDPALPEGTCGVYLGGGFPEVHAAALSDNRSLVAQVKAGAEAGLPIAAECAGLLYLCETLDGRPMIGAVPLRAAMQPRLTMGYRTATAPADSLLGRVGETVTGHEFHRTGVLATDDAQHTAAWQFTDVDRLDGIATPTLHASYLHMNWAGHPQVAQRFADAVHAFAARVEAGDVALTEPQAVAVNTTPLPDEAPDLDHHGDRDIAAGLVDLAVNVRSRTPSPWLRDALEATLDHLAAYPDAREARQAIADHHGVDASMVLPTAGAAEAFTLIARGLGARKPLVVHPQFTEPEAALRAAGADVRRLILSPDNGFAMTTADVNEVVFSDADLVVIGNPTNPTSVLHARADIAQWVRPGRVVVVDEAFMDAVEGEPESMISPDMTGVLVTRSLTKSWGLAGLRVGYLIGDPSLIARLEGQQPPWSVSTPALAAIQACLQAEREGVLTAINAETARQRAYFANTLAAAGFAPVATPEAPFVLINTEKLGAGSQRLALADLGFAVRRGETFPGLGPAWLRLAVCDEPTADAFAEALGTLANQKDDA